MKIDINLVKELRDLTYAPLGDCKKALEEAEGDVQRAKDILKENGVLKAWKKADRETTCWIVKFLANNGLITGVKVLCETDFVAKNEVFQKLVDDALVKISQIPWEFTDETVDLGEREKIQTFLHENVATIGENLQLGYVFKQTGKVFVYNHMGNTISAIVWYEGDDETAAKDVALQVAAMNPMYISMEDIPADAIAEKREEFLAEFAESNKPADIKEKIIEGKIQKAFQDDVLLEQISIRDTTKTVKNMLHGIKVTKILRVNVG